MSALLNILSRLSLYNLNADMAIYKYLSLTNLFIVRYLEKNTPKDTASRRLCRGDLAYGHLFINNFVKIPRIGLVNKMPLF